MPRRIAFCLRHPGIARRFWQAAHAEWPPLPANPTTITTITKENPS